MPGGFTPDEDAAGQHDRRLATRGQPLSDSALERIIDRRRANRRAGTDRISEAEHSHHGVTARRAIECRSILHQKSVPTLAREGHDAVMQRTASLCLEPIASAGIRKDDIGVFDTIAVFAVGTGIGCGLVINNQLHRGIGGTGSELGHTIIDYNGPLCGCGNRGCVEPYASGPAIAAMGMKAFAQGLATCLGEMCEYHLNRITPELIAEAARAGDEIAKDIYERAGYYLGITVANVCCAIGPRRIIIAGGVSRAGNLLLDPIRRTMRDRVRVMPAEEVEIVQSRLGDLAGIIGTACWVAAAQPVLGTRGGGEEAETGMVR